MLPALTELTGDDDGRSFAPRVSFGNTEEVLKGLPPGITIWPSAPPRPRNVLLTATALRDEEHVLVAAPAGRAGWVPDGRAPNRSRH